MKKTGWLFLLILLSNCNTFPQVNPSSINNVGRARQMHFENEDDFLNYVQRQYFNFVWDAALQQSGLSRVRILADDPEKDKHTITMGSSGFGIAGILVGIERGFVTRQQGIERLEKIAGFLERSDRFHGMWSHWVDDRTGKTMPFANPDSKDNGGDVVESAFLAEGILCARQYLEQGTQKEKALAARFDKLWKEMDWLWYYNETEKALMWHWSPNYGWEKNFPLRGYNECLIPYILGAASPTHPVPKEAYYQGWGRDGKIVSDTTLYGFPTYAIHNTGKQYVGPIFWVAFSYVGFNPQGLKDELGTNYWKVNTNQAAIQQAYCIENPNGFKGYGADCWGFSAGYSVKGYKAHNTKTDAGVITPSGTLAAMPYVPEKVMPALKHFYFDLGDELWGPYGFYDGYIADSNTVIKNYLANNQCAALPMIENYRTGLLWKLFMSAPEISVALNKLGFTADTNY
ncbi:hypothetical protein FACS1894182_11550 [Bacteroidia bacterium]|nr:hypothetical protein FACS1894182_11550 [Bacteroidia bacterium]